MKHNSKIWSILCIGIVLVVLMVFALPTAFIDPFFHFHAPREALSYPLNNQRYQNDGIVRHFDYDALITGTSMTENFRTTEFDALFDSKAIKVCYSGGTFPELVSNLEQALEQILDLVRGNAQTSEELCAFVDAFSPSVIAKRNSIDYLTQELADIYMELAQDCNIPKTCYALLSSIRTNPDSPYPNETFYLRNKTQRFLHTYVHPIGDVIEAMQDEEMRQKFLTAYNKLEAQILEKMG